MERRNCNENQVEEIREWDQRDSMAGKAFALHAANLDTLLGTSSSLEPVRTLPEHGAE